MKALDLDWKPLLLVPVLALVAWPLTGSFSTWLTLTVAGLAMGMIIFVIASGLTLIFGLMDVLNFGHGVFIALGAFVASSVLVFGALAWTLGRTKIGLLIRAGVQDREMVESLGYRIGRLFVGVFVVGSALAGLGGVMWGLFQQNLVPQMGSQVLVLTFIVIIIGGLGSTGGALIGALLVGLMNNYVGFLLPTLTQFATIFLMVVVLVWRPQGVYSVTNR
jgi:branched-subunit amino acid ABC-type transport system permease component